MDDKKQESLLDGCRVLDLTDAKGLFCGRVLADLGADVIKIERPGGDQARDVGPFYNDFVHKEKSLSWFYMNLNKRGITLDMEKVDGKEIFKRLVQTADFVIESFDPGYMDGLGLDYEELEKINPRIIVVSITPYGRTGPHKDFKHSDLTTWAMGGMMNLCGDSDRAPVRTYPQADFHGGLHAAIGAVTAHYFREMTGEGQHVDVSIQQACMLTLMISAEYWDVLKTNIPRSGSSYAVPRSELPPLIIPQVAPCKDGHVTFPVMVGASPVHISSNDALTELMNQDQMAENLKEIDWGSLSADTIPQEEYDAIRQTIDKWLVTKTKSELYEEAIKKKIMLSPVSNMKDIAENPQLRARDYWVKVAHPEVNDKITYPGAPAKLNACPWQAKRRAPLIGEHNKEIYQDEFGYTQEQLSLLKANNVI